MRAIQKNPLANAAPLNPVAPQIAPNGLGDDQALWS